MGKLKAALGAHQHNAARAAAHKAREAARAAAAKDAHRSPAEKRALKRQRREREEKERLRVAAGRRGRPGGSRTGTGEGKEKGKGRQAEDDVEEDGGDGADGDSDGLLASVTASTSASAAAAGAAAAAARATIPLAHDDTILLLGEANFSFAAALLARGHAGHLLCATAYDSEPECVDKYPDAAEHIAALRTAGARVAFGVDAGALHKCKAVGKGRRWSRVVFNFPHVGKGITDQDRNVRANQEMLLRTLASVSNVLTEGPSAFPLVMVKKGGKKRLVVKMPKADKKRKRAADAGDSDGESEADGDDAEDGMLENDGSDGAASGLTRPVPSSFTPPYREGTLLITLLDQLPYTLWDVKGHATRPPPLCPGTKLPQPRYRLLRSFEFVPAVYPGYAHRRTIGWREGKSYANNEEIVGRKGKARTYEFALRSSDADDL